MNKLPWQMIGLAILLAIELGYMAAKTYRRPPARLRRGYVTTAIWGICFFGSLAAAIDPSAKLATSWGSLKQ